MPDSKLTICFPAMSYIVNDDLLGLSVNAVDDAIVTDAYPIQMFRASQFDRLPRNRVLLQSLDSSQNAHHDIPGQCAKVLFYGGLEDDAIRAHFP